MSSNPYAKKFGASAREQQRAAAEADLYSFNPSAAGNELIAATIGNSAAAGGGYDSGGLGGGGGGYLGTAQQQAPLTSQRPPGTAMGGPGASFDGPRPMTSAKGAGYMSAAGKKGAAGNAVGGVFDPLGQASTHGPAPPLIQRSADSPEHQAKDLEKAVNKLLEESACAAALKNHSLALEKAKDAGKLERALCKHREKNGLSEQINFDLTYAVCFHLANAYASSKMYTEALNAYSLIVKNKAYPQSGRLRVNMGNIYYIQKKYPSAIKMYRMAMDQIGGVSKEMRYKIMKNIGTAFIKLGQFQDAISAYEACMDQAPDPQAGYNLLICYYALGEKEKMRKTFIALLGIQEYAEYDADDLEEEEEDAMNILHPALRQVSSSAGSANKKAAILKPSNPVLDELKQERRARKKVIQRYLQMAARLIAPVIEKDLSSGFDWVIQHLKAPREVNAPVTGGGGVGREQQHNTITKAGFPSIAMSLEIAKGISFLKRRSIREAIEVFKGLEKTESNSSTSGTGSSGVLDQAATNLSFLYFLEGDMKNTEKYSELAVRTDRYNAKALVNKANYLYLRGEYESAKELYLEAIGVEADCIEAIYNLGLVNKRIGAYKDSLQAFKKLYRILPKDTSVLWHLGNLHEILGDTQEAMQLFTTLHGMVPSDAKILSRLGTLATKEDDETSAFHNFHDSFQVYPVQMEVISWLGVWYVKSGMYEDAIQYFERASEIEPGEVKWKLMVASCYRRMNDYKQALHLYKKIHKQEPENVECLRYLCTICKEHNDHRDYEEYSKLLKKAEQTAAMKDQQQGRQQQQQYRGEEQHQQHQQQDDLDEQHQPPMQRQTSHPDQQQKRAPVNHADGFRPEIHPQSQGPTFASVAGGGGADEWGGEGLVDELLP